MNEYRVYMFWGGNTLLYVGHTKDLARRLREHARDCAWWNDVTHGRVYVHASKTRALADERYAIHYGAPAHNILGSPFTAAA